MHGLFDEGDSIWPWALWYTIAQLSVVIAEMAKLKPQSVDLVFAWSLGTTAADHCQHGIAESTSLVRVGILCRSGWLASKQRWRLMFVVLGVGKAHLCGREQVPMWSERYRFW